MANKRIKLEHQDPMSLLMANKKDEEIPDLAEICTNGVR